MTPPPELVSTAGFDLTGYATPFLALVTTLLAIAAFLQANISQKAISEGHRETERAFGFESLRHAQSMTPIVVAEASPRKPEQYRFLALRNAGLGSAINVRMSGVIVGDNGGSEFTAAQHSVAALGPSSMTITAIPLHKNFNSRWPIHELLIRYEDIFGNTYSTEYSVFALESEWYTWRRPWLGKELGVERPADCSEDDPTWGFQPRAYYDAQNRLF